MLAIGSGSRRGWAGRSLYLSLSRGVAVRFLLSCSPRGHAYRVDMDSREASVRDQIAQGLEEHSAKKGARFNIFVTVVEIGGSLGLFTSPAGWAPVTSSAT